MADTLLDVINDKNEVIGQELRSIIHGNGLMHREIHVWFITPDKKVIFQKRSLKKETNPGLLTVAVGGHVEGGSSYDQTALIEAEEETGLKLLKSDIHYFMTYKDDVVYPNKLHNVVLRAVYGAVFKGKKEDLKLEVGDSDGFFFIPFEDLLNPSDELLNSIQPRLLEDEFAAIRDPLAALVA